MTDADSVSELPEEATALVEVHAPADEQRKRKKERKKKKEAAAESGADAPAAEEGAGAGDDSGGVVIDVEPKALSVKQRRKKRAKNRIKRRKARLAKLRKREAAQEEEERRRAEQIAYEQRRMQRRQAYLERHQAAEPHGAEDGGCAWDETERRSRRRPARTWDAAPALAAQGDGVDIDFRAAPDAVAPAKAPAQQKQQKQQYQKQQEEQQTAEPAAAAAAAEGPKVVTSRSWNSLFAGKGKSEPAAPLFAKQGAAQGGFSFLGGASAFPDTLPSNIFTRDGFHGGNRNQQQAQEQQDGGEHGAAAAAEGEAPSEPAAKKKNRSAGLKGESLFADLDQQFVPHARLCCCAYLSLFVLTFWCLYVCLCVTGRCTHATRLCGRTRRRCARCGPRRARSWARTRATRCARSGSATTS